MKQLMQEAEFVEKPAVYLCCPHCGEPNDYPARITGEPDDWWHEHGCHNCGGAYSVTKKDFKFFVTPLQGGMIDAYALVEINNLFYVVESRLFKDHKISDNKYYYEEHSCTINIVRSAVVVINKDERGADSDPHRIAKFIGIVPKEGAGDIRNMSGKEILQIFGVEKEIDIHPVHEKKMIG